MDEVEREISNILESKGINSQYLETEVLERIDTSMHKAFTSKEFAEYIKLTIEVAQNEALGGLLAENGKKTVCHYKDNDSCAYRQPKVALEFLTCLNCLNYKPESWFHRIMRKARLFCLKQWWRILSVIVIIVLTDLLISAGLSQIPFVFGLIFGMVLILVVKK